MLFVRIVRLLKTFVFGYFYFHYFRYQIFGKVIFQRLNKQIPENNLCVFFSYMKRLVFPKSSYIFIYIHYWHEVRRILFGQS